MSLTLAARCPKIAANKIMDLCGVYYPDRIGRLQNQCQAADAVAPAGRPDTGEVRKDVLTAD